MNNSVTEEWKNKFHPIEFGDNIKVLPLLFEYLQAFCRGSVAKVYIIIWIRTVLCLSPSRRIENMDLPFIDYAFENEFYSSMLFY